MNCKICENPMFNDEKGYYIEEKDKRHGICDACWERIEKEETGYSNGGTEFTKTMFIKIINVIQLIGCLILAIIAWNEEESLQGFTYLGIGLVLFAFIKGFTDIIDLLDSINDKLDNK